MGDFQFLPEIPINIDHTLHQLLGRFQSVKEGIPELIKNSKDQYSRLGLTEKADRQIVVIADSKRNSVAVLDFAGAEATDFEQWVTWSDPNANRAERAKDIEGGHGNGGKAFMVRGSTIDSFMESYVAGKRTKMGFKNDDPTKRHRPAYLRENGCPVQNVDEANPKAKLKTALKCIGLSLGDLPSEAQAAFERRGVYTLVQVNGISSWEGRRPATVRHMANQIATDIIQHPQAALTVESCTAWVIIDGRLAPEPLAPDYPIPMPGFEKIAPVEVPPEMPDPATGELIQTGEGDIKTKYLQLRTSKRHLRQGDTKALNVIRVRNDRNIVSNWSVADLVPQNESAFILGEVRVPAIKDVVGADRKDLADTPLNRAIQHWVTQHVEELAHKIQTAVAKDHKPEDRDKANDSLRRMRELMRRFLDPDPLPGDSAGDMNGSKSGSGSGKNVLPPPPPPPPPALGQVVHKVVLESERGVLALATGTALPLVIRCYEIKPDGEALPVHDVEFELQSEGSGVVELEQNKILRAKGAGIVNVSVREKSSGTGSNQIKVEILDCIGVDIVGIDRLLLKGERVKLTTSFHTPSGHREDLLVEAMVDETDVGRVSRNGYFTAGHTEGTATVRVRYGPGLGDTNAMVLHIGPDELPKSKHGGGEAGGDIPLILMCGTEAPGMEEYPTDQRTHRGGAHHPTIIEEPPFDYVVWINPDSKEAFRIRQGRGGRKGAAGIGSKLFTQFIAMKCFDILKRLKVRHDVKDRLITELEFRNGLAMAEMDCADFIDDAFELADKLYEGEPEKPE